MKLFALYIFILSFGTSALSSIPGVTWVGGTEKSFEKIYNNQEILANFEVLNNSSEPLSLMGEVNACGECCFRAITKEPIFPGKTGSVLMSCMFREAGNEVKSKKLKIHTSLKVSYDLIISGKVFEFDNTKSNHVTAVILSRNDQFRLTKNVFKPDQIENNFGERGLEFSRELVNKNKTPLIISTISKEYADELFNDLSCEKHIPFLYPKEGCYARAHEMSVLLEKRGVITGKAFVEGDLKVLRPRGLNVFVSWHYHVSPFVYVEDEGKVSLYVFDPSMFTEVVSFDKWVNRMTKASDGFYTNVEFTSRYYYTPLNFGDAMYSYNKFHLENTKSTLKENLELIKE